MSLENIMKPFKVMDTELVKGYTKIGRLIPEKDLYKVTTTLSIVGLGSGFYWDSTIAKIIPDVIQIPIFTTYNFLGPVPDLFQNIDGLKGRIRSSTDEEITLNPAQEFRNKRTKIVRLPIFLAGTAYIGKAAYNLADHIMNGAPISPNITAEVMTGLGLLSTASSIYLKDQNPKLLQKQPSKIKELLAKVYDKIKSLGEAGELQPVPMQRNNCRVLLRR